MPNVDLAIIGAGPAGLSAALAAKACGLKPLVVDENPQVGGQIFRQIPEAFTVQNPESLGHTYKKGQSLLKKVASAEIDLKLGTTVWGLFQPLTLGLISDAKSEALKCKSLILATGAYDRIVPFPGWTLPGVMTLGGAQALVKSQRVLPGKNIVLSGSGPFLLPVASQILKGGSKISALLEATKPIEWWPKALSLWGQWERFLEAWEYLPPIIKAKTPVKFGQAIIEARGNDVLEEVVVASLDSKWKPIPGTEYTLSADAVGIGYGFSINTQLSRLCGCEHEYKEKYGGWVIKKTPLQQTSVPNVFAAGEATGIAGVDTAMAEGSLAGISAALALESISESEALIRQAPYIERINKLRPFVQMLAELFTPKKGFLSLPNLDTIVCRCEEVTLSAIQLAFEQGATDVKGIKSRTRVGMGVCQGRICGRITEQLIAGWTNQSPEAVGSFTSRPISKPVTLEAIANTDIKTQ